VVGWQAGSAEKLRWGGRRAHSMLLSEADGISQKGLLRRWCLKVADTSASMALVGGGVRAA